MTDALRLTDVRKVYRTDVRKKPQVALDRLSVSFPQGACTGLLGHNGAGKTTTIRMILGLVRPDAGQILFEGHPLRVQDKQFIGYMPEINKLPAALTPHEILHNHLRLFKHDGFASARERHAAVDRQLDLVGLTAHRKKRIGQLSKGMARRVAWAQSIIHRPRLLILDEPSSGLDPYGRREMLQWIAEEKAKGTTIVLCTHELLQVHSLCDGFHILNRGRLVFSTSEGVNVGSRAERQVYRVHVSGASEAELERYIATGRLPSWTGIAHEGFMTKITLPDYQAATNWVTTLLADGLLVVRYGDEAWLGEEEILPYFKGDD